MNLEPDQPVRGRSNARTSTPPARPAGSGIDRGGPCAGVRAWLPNRRPAGRPASGRGVPPMHQGHRMPPP